MAKLRNGKIGGRYYRAGRPLPKAEQLALQRQDDLQLLTRPLKSPESLDEILELLATETPQYQAYLDQLTPAKIGRIKQGLAHMRHGLHMVAPLTCHGPEKCLFFNSCPIPDKDKTGRPIPESGIYPLYQSCVYEKSYIQQKLIDYVIYLNIDPHNPVEIAIANDLALIDLLKNRALLIMANGDRDGQGRDFLRVDMSLSTSDRGTVSSSMTTLHPVATYIDTLEKRKERWLDKLIETRKGKAELAHRLGTIDQESELARELKEMRKFFEEQAKKTIEGDQPILLGD